MISLGAGQLGKWQERSFTVHLIHKAFGKNVISFNESLTASSAPRYFIMHYAMLALRVTMRSHWIANILTKTSTFEEIKLLNEGLKHWLPLLKSLRTKTTYNYWKHVPSITSWRLRHVPQRFSGWKDNFGDSVNQCLLLKFFCLKRT